jgi:hypothetical protein
MTPNITDNRMIKVELSFNKLLVVVSFCSSVYFGVVVIEAPAVSFATRILVVTPETLKSA